MKSLSIVLLLVLALLLLVPNVDAQPPDDWQAVINEIEASPIDDMILIVSTDEGPAFSYTKGDLAMDERYRIASASKWYTAATAMTLVEDGTLRLDGYAYEYLPWWTADSTDHRSRVTIEHMLAFTTGAQGNPRCLGNGDITNEQCSRQIYDEIMLNPPGDTYFYSGAHMHILGTVIEEVTGQSFNAVFRERIADPLGMSGSTGFFFPSLQNPRPAGGAVSTAADYMLFLDALVNGELLAESRDLMFADYTADAEMLYRPDSVPGDWHYALGAWRECYSDTWLDECAANVMLSSTGAFGFYPWIDVAGGHYGVLAQSGSITDRPSEQSIALMVNLHPLIDARIAE